MNLWRSFNNAINNLATRMANMYAANPKKFIAILVGSLIVAIVLLVVLPS